MSRTCDRCGAPSESRQCDQCELEERHDDDHWAFIAGEADAEADR